jgi:hypothetical protein
MQLGDHYFEITVGGVVIAATVLAFMYKSGFIRFGKKENLYVPRKDCLHHIEACSSMRNENWKDHELEKKEREQIVNSMKEAIVLQTQIVSQHDERFNKIEDKMDRMSCELKNMYIDVKVIKNRVNGVK